MSTTDCVRNSTVMNNERLKGMIGLAIKAGKTLSGAFAVEGAVGRGKARLAIIDGRASASKLKQFQLLCQRHGVKCVVLQDSGVLESLLGRDNRMVMAILDNNFATAIYELANKNQGVQE